MKSIVTALVILFCAHANADIVDITGAYLGEGSRCGVEVSLEGDNQLRFTVFDKKGEEEASEVVPFSAFNNTEAKSDFEYFKEFFSARGKTKVTVSGKIVRNQLRSIRIKKVYSFFNFKTASCNGMTALF